MLIDEHPQLRALPRAQMLQLADELYSLFFTGSPQPSDDEIYAELERSLKDYHQNPESASTWEEVKARLLARRNA